MKIHAAVGVWFFGLVLALGSVKGVGAVEPVRTAADAPPPVAAFGRDSAINTVVLSPSGLMAAYLQPTPEAPFVDVLDLAAGKVIHHVRIARELIFQGLLWGDDGTLLIVVQFTRPGGRSNEPPARFSRVLAYELATSQSRILLMGGGDRALVSASKIVCVCGPRPGTILMWTLDYSAVRADKPQDSHIQRSEDDAWISTLYEVDLRSGKGRAVATGLRTTGSWLATADLSVVIRQDLETGGTSVLRSLLPSGGWRTLYSSAASEVRMYGFSGDGRELVITAVEPGQVRRKALAIAVDGTGVRVLAEDPVRDIESITVDRYTQRPLSLWLDGNIGEQRFLDSATEARHAALRKSFGGRIVQIYNESRDGNRGIAWVAGPSQAPIYYLIDFRTGRADIVGETRPELANKALADVRMFRYKARDGYELQALLSVPPGAGSGRLPLVVFPHDGPESQDDLIFDPWSQFIATRGYLVIQPQYRGSSGRGDKHLRAGYRQWGALMQDDVTDAVKAMVEQGLADPRRVCIFGIGYGGYAALAGAAFTPDTYACAVSVTGISNLSDFLNGKRRVFGKDVSWADPRLEYWATRIGLPDDPEVIAHSPINAVDRIRAPVLLIHATKDTDVPFEQSQKMADALGRLGKPVKLLRLEGATRATASASTRVLTMTEVEAFLARYLGGAGTR